MGAKDPVVSEDEEHVLCFLATVVLVTVPFAEERCLNRLIEIGFVASELLDEENQGR